MLKFIKLIIIAISIVLLAGSGYLIYNFYNQSFDISLPIQNLKGSSPESTALIKAGDDFKNENDYKNAIKSYLSAHNENPDAASPYIGIGTIYYQLEKFDLAEKNLTSAYTKGPLDTNSSNIFLRILIQNNELAKATELVKKIKEPNTESVFLDAILNLNKGNHKIFQEDIIKLSSLTTNDKYVELSKILLKSNEIFLTFTDSPISYLQVLAAQNLIDNKEHVIARSLLFSSLKIKNDYRDAYLLLGYSLLLSDKNKDAEQALEKSLQIDPYFAKSHFYYGLSLLKQEDYQNSIASFLQALSSNYEPKFDVYKNLGNAYFEIAEYQKAADNYYLAQNITPLSLNETSKLLEILIERLNNPVEALNIANKNCIMPETNAKSSALLGYALLSNQKKSEAKNHLLNSIKIDPNDPETYIYIAKLNVAENKKTEAKTNLEKAKSISKNPKLSARINTEIDKLNSM